MSEEEKKAIEDVKKLSKTEYYGDMYFWERRSIQVLLNLLEKQQKEIEEKDKKIKALQTIITRDLTTNQECISTFCGIPIEEAIELVTDGIPKEAIRERIRKIESETWYISDSTQAKNSCIEELEELLGE